MTAAYDWFWKKMDSLTESKPMTSEQIKQYREEQLQKSQEKKSSVFNALDSLFHKISPTAGICTPNLEHLRDYLEKAEHYTKKAQYTVSFVSVDSTLSGKLEKSAAAIAGVREYIEKSANAIGNISAACEISEAIAVLNKWAVDPNGDNKQAAIAFDNLFGGVSRYAEKLPVPINVYSKILSQIEISHFFTNMQALGDSRVGGNTLTPTGRQMKAVLDELDSQGRGR